MSDIIDDSINIKEINDSINNIMINNNYISVKILSHTHLCPEYNFEEDNPEYYITLLDDIVVNISNEFTFTSFDKSQYFNINNKNNKINSCQSILIPKGTRYIILDNNKDKIKLVHAIETDQCFVIKNFTKVCIYANTEMSILSNEKSLFEKSLLLSKEKVFNDNINLYLKNDIFLYIS